MNKVKNKPKEMPLHQIVIKLVYELHFDDGPQPQPQLVHKEEDEEGNIPLQGRLDQLKKEKEYKEKSKGKRNLVQNKASIERNTNVEEEQIYASMQMKKIKIIIKIPKLVKEDSINVKENKDENLKQNEEKENESRTQIPILPQNQEKRP